MFRKSLATLLISFLAIACQKDQPAPLDQELTELNQQIDELIISQIDGERKPFNWNDQSSNFICEALPLANRIMVVGFETDLQGKNNLDYYLRQHQEVEIADNNQKLGIYYLRIDNCDHISAIRNLTGIRYIELDHFPSDLSSLILPMSEEEAGRQSTNYRGGNPGSYIPGSTPYLTYLAGVDGGTADRAYLENMDRVYHELGYYGSAETGIAVIDNGVKEDKVDYFSVGPGGYEIDGYFIKNFGNPANEPDGPHPLPSDLFGIWALIGPAHGHGTGMTDNVYSLAPFAHRMTIRASPTYILAAPNQMRAITNAITALADDDDIKVISMSMAGVIGYNQMTSAIRYFNSKNKIMVSAAGSSLPILKDLLGILYPARLPETISVTGIDALAETNGNPQLGIYAHGGPQNDFIIENASSSSTATSTFAGMLGVIWSINPTLDREVLIQLMIDNSSYNISQGSKHQKFGWGKIDMYQLALDVEATL